MPSTGFVQSLPLNLQPSTLQLIKNLLFTPVSPAASQINPLLEGVGLIIDETTGYDTVSRWRAACCGRMNAISRSASQQSFAPHARAMSDSSAARKNADIFVQPHPPQYHQVRSRSEIGTYRENGARICASAQLPGGGKSSSFFHFRASVAGLGSLKFRYTEDTCRGASGARTNSESRSASMLPRCQSARDKSRGARLPARHGAPRVSRVGFGSRRNVFLRSPRGRTSSQHRERCATRGTAAARHVFVSTKNQDRVDTTKAVFPFQHGKNFCRRLCSFPPALLRKRIDRYDSFARRQ